ncbi:MAG: DUF2089 domain-containing protein [Pseudomonadota bacterium]
MDISKARCADCGQPMTVHRMVCHHCDLTLEGDIDVPALGRLTQEDQIFVTAFIRCHGSIKRMEALFDISYPTVKNRLNRIAEELDATFVPPPNEEQASVLDRVAAGEITVDEALELLS